MQSNVGTGLTLKDIEGADIPFPPLIPPRNQIQRKNVCLAQTLDLTGADTFVALVPKTGPCTVADAESELTLQPGELVLVPAACKGVTLQGHCLVKSIKCVN